LAGFPSIFSREGPSGPSPTREGRVVVARCWDTLAVASRGHGHDAGRPATHTPLEATAALKPNQDEKIIFELIN